MLVRDLLSVQDLASAAGIAHPGEGSLAAHALLATQDQALRWCSTTLYKVVTRFGKYGRDALDELHEDADVEALAVLGSYTDAHIESLAAPFGFDPDPEEFISRWAYVEAITECVDEALLLVAAAVVDAFLQHTEESGAFTSVKAPAEQGLIEDVVVNVVGDA